jgi:hypothetical protein
MSQKKTSIKVPSDLLPAIKTFHEIREKVKSEIEATNAEYQTFQLRIAREQKRLDGLFTSALIVLQEALVKAKLVTAEQVFVINTDFLDAHGEAYLVFENTTPETSEPPRTLH